MNPDNETAERLRELANLAVRLEWGTEDQIDAQNAFSELAESLLTEKQAEEWYDWCLKATTSEMIEWAMQALAIEWEQSNEA